jgi:hypothetical protein
VTGARQGRPGVISGDESVARNTVVGECGLSRSGPIGVGERAARQWPSRLCVTGGAGHGSMRHAAHTFFASPADREQVWGASASASNDERADGLPVGNIRLEDTPASGFTTSPPPNLPPRPAAVAVRWRWWGVLEFRCRPREEGTHEWDICLGGQVLPTVAWTTCLRHAICLEHGRGRGCFGWNAYGLATAYCGIQRGAAPVSIRDLDGLGFFSGGLCHKTNTPYHNTRDEVSMRNDKR